MGIAAGVFFVGEGRSWIWGHVQIVKYACFTYFKHFPRCGYCRRRFFFREKGRSRILGTCHIGENTVFQLFCVSGALWVTFGVPLAPFGVALAPFGVPLGSLWGALWLSLAPFGPPCAHLGAPLGALGIPCDPFLEMLENLPSRGSQSQFFDRRLQRNWGSGICPAVPAVPAVPAKWWHEVLLGAPLPHAPGVRMT